MIHLTFRAAVFFRSLQHACVGRILKTIDALQAAAQGLLAQSQILEDKLRELDL